MMLYPAVNELNKKVDSRYTLCILTAKRARDIISGKPVLTKVKAERPVSLAANEINEDLITYYRKEEEPEVEAAAEEIAAAEEAVEPAEAVEAPVEAEELATEAADEE